MTHSHHSSEERGGGRQSKGLWVCLADKVPLKGSALAFHSSTRTPWDLRQLKNPTPHPCIPCP